LVKPGERLDGSEVAVHITNIATLAANNHGAVSFEMEYQTAIKEWLMRVAFSSLVFVPAIVTLESLRRLSGRLDVNRTVLSHPLYRSKSTRA
jgi:hypothetical protein